jgi:uncharacterized protein (TIGR02246 family)
MSSFEPTPRTSDATRASSSSAGAPAQREAIDVANAQFMSAFRAADAGACADCYTRDAQLLPANSEPVSGTDAIASFWGGAMRMGIADVKLETVELESQGDLAVEVGRYILAGADGGAIDNGKYVVVWHRDGGTWKLHRDIWTTNRPAPGA